MPARWGYAAGAIPPDGRRVVDLEDELFAPDGAEASAEVLGLSGPSVLRAALERAHTGRIRDIVARSKRNRTRSSGPHSPGLWWCRGDLAPARRPLPCTGPLTFCTRTASPLEVQGVLVVETNPTFLRYIDQVLPSLGETGAELSTASGLYKGARPVAAEPAAVTRLKGDPRMAGISCRRAVHERERPLRRAVEIPVRTPGADTYAIGLRRHRQGRQTTVRLAMPAGGCSSACCGNTWPGSYSLRQTALLMALSSPGRPPMKSQRPTSAPNCAAGPRWSSCWNVIRSRLTAESLSPRPVWGQASHRVGRWRLNRAHSTSCTDPEAPPWTRNPVVSGRHCLARRGGLATRPVTF